MILKKTSLRLSAFLLMGAMLVSCGGPVAETETKKPEPGYPSIGVGRPVVDVPVEENGITICIDPGHGFDDVGCSSDYLADEKEEKDMTLQYAYALKAELEGMGYTVFLTHDGNTFPEEFNSYKNNIFSADERAAYVNSLDVDYFISLHCDTFDEDDSIGGIRIYYYDSPIKTATYSDAVANSISAHLAKEFPDAKVPSVHDNQSYVVLRTTTMAASLIEIGFISNKNDAENIQNPEWQEKFIAGVAAGIDGYFSLYQ